MSVDIPTSNDLKRVKETEWTDKTHMPFGKHDGKLLEDIPDKYFAWLIDQVWVESKFPGLYDYAIIRAEDYSDENEYPCDEDY